MALPVDEVTMRRAEEGEAGAAAEVVAEILDHDDDGQEVLGQLQAVDGSYGRGAAAWCAVAEWALDAAGQGVVGGAAFVSVVAAARWLRDKLERLRADRRPVLVSPGAAILLAAIHVLEATDETELPSLKAAEDTVTVSGARHTSLDTQAWGRGSYLL